jgi:hypothetical protein
MSSPFSVETKRGTEESIEALGRASTWLRRVSGHDISGSLDDSISEITTELDEAQEELIAQHQHDIVDREVDNFVVNYPDEVLTILNGDLDERVSGLEHVKEYISDDFGYVDMPSLTKENLLWLVAQKVVEKKNSRVGPEEYEELTGSEIETLGSEPDF